MTLWENAICICYYESYKKKRWFDYLLPPSHLKEGPSVVFTGCHLCGCQALNSVLPLPLPPQNPGAFWGTPRLSGLCGAATMVAWWSFKAVRQKLLALIKCCFAAPIIFCGCYLGGSK